ncbi:hypothetical protein IMG5_112020 [Ichthyophthirius multifiliis]|uniref:PHD-type domain-containing protein n=1 Tax=Ichthyophthirius multifiliis TaxID=5932 RepID=G0QTV4_ICHMU|nr:hypothetical protein IMG5_112020 [Ichthyophthirius multifiliis]EGR31358.1 hypothetical protein IMG5_112020 [Ichthyophthirius multifiliis]|eukprot:XP_004034844.1 hypothetical protein IMG5_112020 [Ichthyophthirius multifiliis]
MNFQISQEQIKELQNFNNNIIFNWPQELDFCDVCLIKVPLQKDELIYCDLCNGLTHQSCYGGQLQNIIPENQWFCQRCELIIDKYLNNKKAEILKCHYCPELKGIMKKYYTVETKEEIWSHIACIAWQKNIKIINGNIIENQYKLKKTTTYCKICGISYGICGYCFKNDCDFSFHYLCAKRQGLIQDTFQMNQLFQLKQNQQQILGQDNYIVYCQKHLLELQNLQNNQFLKGKFYLKYVSIETIV